MSLTLTLLSYSLCSPWSYHKFRSVQVLFVLTLVFATLDSLHAKLGLGLGLGIWGRVRVGLSGIRRI